MKKYFLLLFVLPLMSFHGLHKFYLSVTDIEYNSDAKTLQVISRVFTDDLEKMLKERYSPDLYLTEDSEHPDAEDHIEKYLKGKLKIEVNGKDQSLKFLGKKYENDIIVLFIEVEEVPALKSISVQNEILTDIFPSQKNVVHVKKNEETKSLLLTRQNKKESLSF